MARGWESKSVEEQQQESARDSKRTRPAVSAEEAARRTKRDTLMLARTGALGQLQHACAPAHRAMLEQAIADLDRQIAALDRKGSGS
jgi:hypothetical protein